MKRLAFPLFGCLVALLAWQAAVELGVLNSDLVDPPTIVIPAYVRLLIEGKTWNVIGLTLLRTIIAFVVSGAIGVIVGLLLGYYKHLNQSIGPIIDFIRSIPGTALVPLFIVCLGIGENAKLGLVIVPTTLIVIVYTMLGVKNSSKTRRTYVRSLGASQWTVFRCVVVQEALPSTFAGLRASISLALVLVIVAEMMMPGNSSGLGRSINDARYRTHYTDMYAFILLCGTLGYALNRLMQVLDNALVHWRGN